MTTKSTSPSSLVDSGLGTFERLLSVWVALAIAAGLLLGSVFPGLFGALAALEVASVNLPVAVLIWAMVYPMMVGVDFSALKQIGERPKGIVITLVVNWLIKPFTMAALGVLFFNHVFAGLIPPDDAQAYIAGVQDRPYPACCDRSGPGQSLVTAAKAHPRRRNRRWSGPQAAPFVFPEFPGLRSGHRRSAHVSAARAEPAGRVRDRRP